MATFKVPENTGYLWLAVIGAHKEDTSGGMGMGFRRRGRGRSGGSDGENTVEQWPYQIKLTGTTLDDSVIDLLYI